MDINNTIAISSDHAGFKYKKMIINFLKEKKYKVKDYGCYSEESIDYPEITHLLAEAVKKEKHTFGIILCGSGNGVAITANKYKKIRAAICWNKNITVLSRTHNNANICCLPARFITFEEALHFVNIFINTKFEGGRHLRRIEKIDI